MPSLSASAASARGTRSAWPGCGSAIPRKAIECWEKCVEFNPEQYDALYNIGRVAGQMGDWKTARAALERFVADRAAAAVRARTSRRSAAFSPTCPAAVSERPDTNRPADEDMAEIARRRRSVSGGLALAAEPPTSWVIAGARVADGTGAPLVAQDVRIDGDRIVEVGKLSPHAGERVVDGKGLVLAPGFIDVHNHSTRGS